MNLRQADFHASLIEGALYKAMNKHPMNVRNRKAWIHLLNRLSYMINTLLNVCDSQAVKEIKNKPDIED